MMLVRGGRTVIQIIVLFNAPDLLKPPTIEVAWNVGRDWTSHSANWCNMNTG